MVTGEKGTTATIQRLRDSNLGQKKVSTLDTATQIRTYDPEIAKGKVTGVTIKFDPGFFRTGVFGQVAVLAVQNAEQAAEYGIWSKLVKAVGATRVWNWPTSKFETTIPMTKWHDNFLVEDEDDVHQWTVIVGTNIARRDPAVEDDDVVLKASIQWLCDCPKSI